MIKKVIGIILVVLGILFLLGSMLWWTVGLSIIVKMPGGIDETLYFEGEATFYVNPSTYEPLGEGNEITQPLKASRRIESLDEEYDSSTAVIKETVEVTILGMKQEPVTHVFVLDRKSVKNKNDDRAYAFEEGIEVNREGTYVIFPFDVSRDGDYPFWRNEINRAFKIEYIGEEEKEGLEVFNFRYQFEDAPVWEDFLHFMGLPTELTFNQLKARLIAMGVDIDGLMSLAPQVLSPEDLQAIEQATQEPIAINYFYNQDLEISVDSKTGAYVDVYKNEEGIAMEVDTTNLMEIIAILMKYQQDPVIGPALHKLSGLQSLIEGFEPQKIFEYQYTQTAESVSDTIQKAKDAGALLASAKLWIPLIVLIVGITLLAIGIALNLKGGESARQEQA